VHVCVCTCMHVMHVCQHAQQRVATELCAGGKGILASTRRHAAPVCPVSRLRSTTNAHHAVRQGYTLPCTHPPPCCSCVPCGQAARYDQCMQRYQASAIKTSQTLAFLNLGQSWIFTAAMTAAMLTTANVSGVVLCCTCTRPRCAPDLQPGQRDNSCGTPWAPLMYLLMQCISARGPAGP